MDYITFSPEDITTIQYDKPESKHDLYSGLGGLLNLKMEI